MTLQQCLQGDLAGRQVILSSDVFRAHTTKEVWRVMARLNFFYFLIPARMTWVVQPCDTHVFAQLKRHLQEGRQTAAVRAEKGGVSVATLINLVGVLVQTVLRGQSWGRAFDDLGLVGNQSAVSCTVLGKLGLDVVHAQRVEEARRAGWCRQREHRQRLPEQCAPRKQGGGVSAASPRVPVARQTRKCSFVW